jgi:hypothetical protein
MLNPLPMASVLSSGLQASELTSLHDNRFWRRRYTICHYDQTAGSELLISRDIEMSRHVAAKVDGHAAMVMAPAIENVPGPQIGNPNERIIRR